MKKNEDRRRNDQELKEGSEERQEKKQARNKRNDTKA